MKSSVSARKRIYRITLDAMLIAFHAIMGTLPSEFSWQSLPVLLCAFLIGPVDAIAVSLIGSFIEQIQYGINAATVLWLLPWLFIGAFSGILAYVIRKNPKVWKIVVIVICSELLLNIANTIVLCYFGYLSADFSATPAVLLVLYIGRMPQALIRAVLSSIAIPALLPPLRKTLAKMH